MKIAFLPLLMLAIACTKLAAADSPNIVFLFADDQTTSTVGCYGNEVIQTPNIDALAARGTRFENAFVSQSICWVSRTTILTGLTGRSYGTSSNPELARPDAVETLYTDLLKDQGYRVGYFGKWHAKMPAGFHTEEHFDEMEIIGRNPYYKRQADGTLRHETDVVVDRGIDFVKSQPKNQPFALNLWFNACHAEDSDRRPGIGHFPWPRELDGMYDDITIRAATPGRSSDLQRAARLLKNDDQSRTLFLALEHGREVPNKHAGLLSHGHRHRPRDRSIDRGA